MKMKKVFFLLAFAMTALLASEAAAQAEVKLENSSLEEVSRRNIKFIPESIFLTKLDLAVDNLVNEHDLEASTALEVRGELVAHYNNLKVIAETVENTRARMETMEGSLTEIGEQLLEKVTNDQLSVLAKYRLIDPYTFYK